MLMFPRCWCTSLLLLLGCFATTNFATTQKTPPPRQLWQYNVHWNQPSVEFGVNQHHQPTWNGTLPIGNGDVAVSVWPNITAGGISLMVAKQDALAADGLPLKVGLIQVFLQPSPFKKGAYFNQTLDLTTGSVIITAGGKSEDECGIRVTSWVDASTNSIVVQASSCNQDAFMMNVEISSLRPSTAEQYTQPFFCHKSTMNPDTIVQKIPSYFPSSAGLIMYHRNLDSSTTFADSFKDQHIASLLSKVNNPFVNRTFGFYVYGLNTDLDRVSPTVLKTKKAVTKATLLINVATAQTRTADLFLQALSEVSAALTSGAPEWWNYGHLKWWNSFWSSSHIYVTSSTDKDPEKITQRYIWNRYLQVIQSRGTYPIKFNGELFVANTPAVSLAHNGGPDYRDWGGSNWYQNTRLPYWNMLGSGDFSNMVGPLFQYYLRTIPAAEGRTPIYFNHTGIYYTETKTVWGLYSPADYGCSRPKGYPVGIESNNYIHVDYHGGLGLSAMMLDHYMYTLDEGVLTANLPFITKTLDFFSHHYPRRDSTGKMIIHPTQALETYWCPWPFGEECCTNDMPQVAGLHAVVTRALQLPQHLTTAAQRSAWNGLKAIIPPLPADPKTNTLKPAEKYFNKRHNSETPELYTVHPFQLFTVAEQHWNNVSISAAINSWHKDGSAHANTGWTQGIMNAALLGLTSNAKKMMSSRGNTGPAQGYRFPGFAPHEQDYEPSADHYANMNSALQWMLVQVEHTSGDAKIVLLPSWPCEWDVDAKLQAGKNTVVQVVVENGKLVNWSVEPAKRKADVHIANCMQ